MRRLILILALGLAACGSNAPPEKPMQSVQFVATAPDGTRLWRVYVDEIIGGKWVYFAASGTENTYACGKGCTRTDIVPTERFK